MLQYLMSTTGVTTAELARLTGNTERTIRNWLTNTTEPPRSVLNFLRIKKGSIGQFHENWNGWIISHDGFLCTPENDVMSPYNVRAGQFLLQNVSHAEIIEACKLGGIEQPY